MVVRSLDAENKVFFDVFARLIEAKNVRRVFIDVKNQQESIVHLF